MSALPADPLAPGLPDGMPGTGAALVPAAHVAAVQRLAAGRRPSLLHSLAVGGRTGTLERRFRNGPGNGNVRAKTGYIRGVRALSGYVRSAGGSRIAFALVCNDFSTSLGRVTAAQDDIAEALARYAR